MFLVGPTTEIEILFCTILVTHGFHGEPFCVLIVFHSETIFGMMIMMWVT
jgi:hypothetical protein